MKVGVIGMGSIGTRHTHNLGGLGHEVLPYDSNGKYLKLSEVLDKADAFVIASPTPSHREYINIVSDTDKPTFVEKPIVDTFTIPYKFDHVKMVGYNLRFHSCVLKAKSWIDAGHLGYPLWANFVCGQKNKKYKDHVILNWSHEIDLALYFFGGGRVLACHGTDQATDIILAHKHWQSTIHLDYVTEPEIRQFIIVGNKASIIVTLAPARVAWLRDASGTMLDTFEGQDDWDDNYVDEMETFIARCEGMETAGCTAQQGLDVLKICLDAIERSK